MRRLVITGLPCPPEAWEHFLGNQPGQRIVSLLEVFEHTHSADLKVMSRYISEVIANYQPQSILCHDFGVPLTLLALLRLKRQQKLPNVKLTLFNGAFRKLDIFHSTHAFRVQWMSYGRAVSEVEAQGGEVDPRLKKYMPLIRAMYRRLIFTSLLERLQENLGLDDFAGRGQKPVLRVPTQTIFSNNDPYIPKESLKQLRQDCPPQRRYEIAYGHFPYSISNRQVLPIIEEFEQASSRTPT